MAHKLFEEIQLGALTLKNRVVMAPMTRCRALSNVPNELMAEYYSQRAAAGLIISEGVAPSPNGLGYARIPGLFSPEQIAGWRLVTDAVHKKGGKMFAQLMHTGRVSHPKNMLASAEIVAPSAVVAAGDMWTDQEGMQPHPVPRAMNLEDIETAQQEYEDAAANAVEAGFDGVELHAANGYLLEQFINPTANVRTDKYGGSAENRARFVIEVLKRVSKRIGAGRVGIRFSPYNTYNGMGKYEGVREQYVPLAQACADEKIAYVHAIVGDHVNPETLQVIQKTFGGPFLLNGAFTGEKARASLDAGSADFISFGASFLANPDLVTKLEGDLELNAPKPDFFFSAEAEGYTDYPALA